MRWISGYNASQFSQVSYSSQEGRLMKGFARILLSVAAVLLASAPALATVETFNGPPAGTVAAGDLPGGGTAPGTLFADFTVSVINNYGPQSCLVYDSANPTGGDFDLGTPNQDFGGPGIGTGGQAGMPGENSVPLGNLLIIAEDIIDGDSDGLVDDPDDDAHGGTIIFEFDYVVDLQYVTIVDIDAETLDYGTFEFGAFIGGGSGSDLGNNSVQTIDLTPFFSVDRLEVHFSSSGAIGEIAFEPAAVPIENTTWGSVKNLYR